MQEYTWQNMLGPPSKVFKTLNKRRKQLLQKIPANRHQDGDQNEKTQTEWMALVKERDRQLKLAIQQENDRLLLMEFHKLYEQLECVGSFDHQKTPSHLKAAMGVMRKQLHIYLQDKPGLDGKIPAGDWPNESEYTSSDANIDESQARNVEKTSGEAQKIPQTFQSENAAIKDVRDSQEQVNDDSEKFTKEIKHQNIPFPVLGKEHDVSATLSLSTVDDNETSTGFNTDEGILATSTPVSEMQTKERPVSKDELHDTITQLSEQFSMIKPNTDQEPVIPVSANVRECAIPVDKKHTNPAQSNEEPGDVKHQVSCQSLESQSVGKLELPGQSDVKLPDVKQGASGQSSAKPIDVKQGTSGQSGASKVEGKLDSKGLSMSRLYPSVIAPKGKEMQVDLTDASDFLTRAQREKYNVSKLYGRASAESSMNNTQESILGSSSDSLD